MIVGGGDQIELIEAPTLALLAKQLNERPLWTDAEKAPLAVDGETYQRGFLEMKEVMARQGWPVISADWIPQTNFLFRGIPVVMNG